MENSSFRTYDPVADLIATGGSGGGGLPSTGGTLTGNLILQAPAKVEQSTTPTLPIDLTNKQYVDNQIATQIAANLTPDATSTVKGRLKLAGDLSGTADLPTVAPLTINNSKLANMTSPNQLKGSNGSSSSVIDIALGSGLTTVGSTLNVDSSTIPVVPVSNGGTGSTSLSGYLKGNGISPVTGVTPIPVADVQGAVLSVNGILPVSGNVSVAVGNVTTGVLSAQPAQPQPNGDIYIVSGDPTPANNGRTFISTGSLWDEITTNQAATDARYVLKAGDTMTGNLNMPTGTKITLTDSPTASADSTNKQYVDTQIALATPNASPVIVGKVQLAGDFDPTSTATNPVIKSATSVIQGKLQLAGDLAGTATAPLVANLAITNAKIAPGTNSTLKGTASGAVNDITLGIGLNMVGTTLSVDTTTTPKAGNAQFGVVEFDSSGDLTQTGANSGIALVKPLAITNAKISPGTASTLKGTNSLSNVDDIIVGAGLSLSSGAGPILSVDTTSVPKAGNTRFGVVEFDATTGDLLETSNNSGIALVKPLAITNLKINPGTNSTLKGTASGTVNDIALGSGLSMTGTTLNVDTTTIPKAGDAQFGVVEFDSSGDLTQTSLNSGIALVKPLAITNAKINPGANSTLKGTASGAVSDITLGANLSMTGTTLNVSVPTTQNAGNAQFGVVEFDSSGDLTQTSLNSGIALVKPLAITNAKINPGANSTLKGTASGAVSDITLGANLSMTGTTLNVSVPVIQNAGNAQFGVVEFDSSGDLTQTSLNSGIALVKPLAITNAKINPGANSTLKGTASGAVSDITLGANLSMTGTTLNVSVPVIQNAGNAQFGVVEFDSSGDLTQTSANSGIALVKPLAITNAKINPGANSTLKGTASGAVSDITLGTGLSMAGTVLSVDTTTVPKAGNAQFGVVEFDSSGDLTQTSANSGIAVIGASKVTNTKLAPGANSTLKGTTALGVVTDITLGAGLSMTGPTLSVLAPSEILQLVALDTPVALDNIRISARLTGGVGFQVATVSGTITANISAITAYATDSLFGSSRATQTITTTLTHPFGWVGQVNGNWLTGTIFDRTNNLVYEFRVMSNTGPVLSVVYIKRLN
jgi:hypothetical protein